MMAQVLSQLFYSTRVLQQLQMTPGIGWKAGFSQRFAGSTKSEIQALLGHAAAPLRAQRAEEYVDFQKDLEAAGAAFSWLEQRPDCTGRETIRDQANCGSCWAFATSNSFNDNRCISGNDSARVQRSEQFMVSCDGAQMGCKGGVIAWGMEFLIESGLPEERCLRYTSGYSGATGDCPRYCEDSTKFRCQKARAYRYVGETPKMRAALQSGTLAAVFSVFEDFMYYQSGVYHHVSGANLGAHAVEIIGYGQEGGRDFWLCKNSWGRYFGEDGYFKFQVDQPTNTIEETVYQVIP